MSELEDTDAESLPARKRSRPQLSDDDSSGSGGAPRDAGRHDQPARGQQLQAQFSESNQMEVSSRSSDAAHAPQLPQSVLLSDDEECGEEPHEEVTPQRQSRRLSGRMPQPVSRRAAAAGEAFRRRLRKRKPPPTAEAVAAARAAQRVGRAVASEPETSYESEPPIHEFIALSEPEGASDADQHPGAAFEGDGGALYQDTDSELEEAAQRAKFVQHRNKRKRPAKRKKAGSSLAGPSAIGAGSSGADAAAAHTAASVAAPTAAGAASAPLPLDDNDELLLSPAARRAQQRSRAAATAEPEATAVSSSDGDDVGDGAADEKYATPRKRLRRLGSNVDNGYTTPPNSHVRRAVSGSRRGESTGRQGTLDRYLTPVAARQTHELEDSDADEPPAPPEDDAGSLEDFIDEEESADSGHDSGASDDDPIPEALRELRRSLDRDMDNHLAEQFANFACGLLLNFMGIEMDSVLHQLWEEGRYRIKSALEQGSKEVSGGLGWVNAEKNGIINAMRRLTQCTTGWDFGGGVQPDTYTEDDKDGRFTCEVCGRSQGSMKPITLKRPCSKEPLSLAVHTLSPQKPRARRRRRRRGSDDESSGDELQNRQTFWVGVDCVQRLMLAQLLQHWTCMFADKYRSVCAGATTLAECPPDKAPDAASEVTRKAAADELRKRQGFLGFWFRHLRRTLALGKKLETLPRQLAFAYSTGTEIITLKEAFQL